MIGELVWLLEWDVVFVVVDDDDCVGGVFGV